MLLNFMVELVAFLFIASAVVIPVGLFIYASWLDDHKRTMDTIRNWRKDNANLPTEDNSANYWRN